MKGFKLRLNRSTEFFVYSIFGALLLTAGVWLWAQSNLSSENPVQGLMMKIHGAAAMAALILIGALINHLRRGWTAKKNRVSGIVLLAAILFLILTGYGLYYSGDEQLRALISRSHTWIGFGLVLLIPGHVLIGRVFRRRRRIRSNRDAVRDKIFTGELSPVWSLNIERRWTENQRTGKAKSTEGAS